FQSPLAPPFSMRTSTSLSLPPVATTALYFTSFVLQNSASLRFAGTFMSGALPLRLTTPLIVAVPILASPPDAAVPVAAPLGFAVRAGGRRGFGLGRASALFPRGTAGDEGGGPGRSSREPGGGGGVPPPSSGCGVSPPRENATVHGVHSSVPKVRSTRRNAQV